MPDTKPSRRGRALLALALVLVLGGSAALGVYVARPAKPRWIVQPAVPAKDPGQPWLNFADQGRLLVVRSVGRAEVWALEPAGARLARGHEIKKGSFWPAWSFAPLHDRVIAHTPRDLPNRGLASGRLRVLAASTGAELAAFDVPGQAVVGCSRFDESGELLLVWVVGWSVEVRKAATGELARSLRLPPEESENDRERTILEVYLSPRADRVAATRAIGGASVRTFVWSLADGKLVGSFEGLAYGFAPTGEVLATDSHREHLAFRSPDGTPVREVFAGAVVDVAASGDALIGIAAGEPAGAPPSVFSAHTGRRLHRCASAKGWRALSSDGTRFAEIRPDGAVEVWELAP